MFDCIQNKTEQPIMLTATESQSHIATFGGEYALRTDWLIWSIELLMN